MAEHSQYENMVRALEHTLDTKNRIKDAINSKLEEPMGTSEYLTGDVVFHKYADYIKEIPTDDPDIPTDELSIKKFSDAHQTYNYARLHSGEDGGYTNIQVDISANTGHLGSAITENYTTILASDLSGSPGGIDYADVEVGGKPPVKLEDAKLGTLNVTENGSYSIDYSEDNPNGLDGWSTVVVGIKSTAKPKTYKVDYYVDGQKWETQEVVKGTIPPPLGKTPTKEGQYFFGWYPILKEIYADTKVDASFTDNEEERQIPWSWEEICSDGGKGIAIGDWKIISIQLPNTTTKVDVAFEKVYEGEDGTTSTWVARNTAAFLNDFKSLSQEIKDNRKKYDYRMPSSGGEIGGQYGQFFDWTRSYFRDYINFTLFNTFPEDLKKNIKYVNKATTCCDGASVSAFYGSSPTGIEGRFLYDDYEKMIFGLRKEMNYPYTSYTSYSKGTPISINRNKKSMDRLWILSGKELLGDSYNIIGESNVKKSCVNVVEESGINYPKLQRTPFRAKSSNYTGLMKDINSVKNNMASGIMTRSCNSQGSACIHSLKNSSEFTGYDMLEISSNTQNQYVILGFCL